MATQYVLYTAVHKRRKHGYRRHNTNKSTVRNTILGCLKHKNLNPRFLKEYFVISAHHDITVTFYKATPKDRSSHFIISKIKNLSKVTKHL
jgi:hypothetical protein